MLLQTDQRIHAACTRTSAFEDALTKSNCWVPVSCTPFDLLQTKYRGQVLAKRLVKPP
jgi:hypothetical protein